MSGWPIRQIAKSEARKVLHEAAWQEPPSEDELLARVAELEASLREVAPDHPALNAAEPRRRIHSFLSGLGADHDLETALDHVGRADEIAWTTHMIRHDLAVRVDGRVYFYDVARPERSEGAA